jgi:hypothetical protein
MNEKEIKDLLVMIYGKVQEIEMKLSTNKDTENTNSPKNKNNTSKGESKTLKGTVAYPEIKNGKKTDFLVFKLTHVENGVDTACKCFDKKYFDIQEGCQVEIEGFYQEWGGYTSFVVEKLSIIGSNSTSETNNSSNEEEVEDDMPF